jgi:8-oxo-dGTP diphosphatase
MNKVDTVQAAGAVLWREVNEDAIEIAVVHRPKYDDWSLPKGKLNRGETHIAAAHREVLEETGFNSKFGPFLLGVSYSFDDVEKVVQYWSAQANPLPDRKPDPSEVDELRWLSPDLARGLLTNRTDREVIARFLEIGARTYTLILLRHAKALKREEWQKDDEDRPLDQVGQIQARNLPNHYLPYGVDQISSSDAMRCAETVFPLSQAMGKIITYVSDLSEFAFAQNKTAAQEYVKELIELEGTYLVCSHNPIIPRIAEKLIGKKTFKSFRKVIEPGEGIVFHFRDGDLVALDWVNAPSSLTI